jgi:dynein regulatry complex protein 1
VSGVPPTPSYRTTSTGTEAGDKKEELGRGRQQIIESKRKLYRVKQRTDQDVSSVRTTGDEREVTHRTAEENTRQVGKLSVLSSMADFNNTI